MCCSVNISIVFVSLFILHILVLYLVHLWLSLRHRCVEKELKFWSKIRHTIVKPTVAWSQALMGMVSLGSENPGLPILRGHVYHSYGLCALSLGLTCNTLCYLCASLLNHLSSEFVPYMRLFADTVLFFLLGDVYIGCITS